MNLNLPIWLLVFVAYEQIALNNFLLLSLISAKVRVNFSQIIH